MESDQISNDYKSFLQTVVGLWWARQEPLRRTEKVKFKVVNGISDDDIQTGTDCLSLENLQQGTLIVRKSVVEGEPLTYVQHD